MNNIPTFQENLRKGIEMENYFATALSKLKWITCNYEIEQMEDSGRHTELKTDVTLTSPPEGKYPDLAFDVKGVGGTPVRVYVPLRRMYWVQQVNNNLAHGYIPFIAFPRYFITERSCKHPSNWYVMRMDKDTYVQYLNSYPHYDKLVRKSMRLTKLDGYLKKYIINRRKI